MSHYMTALAMKQVGLKPAAKIVLYWLADHHNGDTGLCCPSLSTLAEECEMDKATVVRHLSSLEGIGLISRQTRYRANGSQTSTEYILSMKQPVAKRDTPCRKTQSPPVAKCAPLNLVSNNLVIEPVEANASLAFSIFNEFADQCGWKKCQKESKPRIAKMKARLKDCGGIDGWRGAMEKAAASDFLCNRASKSFSATIDFILQESSFTKLMEGNYDNRTNGNAHNGSGSHNGTSRPGSGTAQAFAATAIKLRNEQDGGGNNIEDSELPF